MPKTQNSTKLCPRCGREFAWRKRWRENWEQVVYCSQRCRRTPLEDLDRELERAILQLLAQRNATICPSEAARAVAPQNWRPLMERARAAARRLCAEEHVEIRQGGRPVNPSTARGALRIARGRRFAEVSGKA